MMLKCVKEISPDQIAHLQTYKNTPLELDYTKDEQLILIDWEDLRYKGEASEP